MHFSCSQIPAVDAVVAEAEQREKDGTSGSPEDLAFGLVGIPPSGVVCVTVSLRLMCILRPRAYIDTMLFGQGAVQLMEKLLLRCVQARMCPKV
jgi:hypothetical protein